MAQKTKVKELVGRGLDSYHTKALQQMDRIEKKNKEQNHKISILSNELDNDYLTKTEEGSVVSLEHSKEGMIYLDELQGNTLVNYCTDGSKELTLNGDIDVEGTFVTTTEGVDNGKVDVYCEGNTLVNLASYKHKYQISVGGNGVVASDVFTMTNQTVKNLKGTVNKNYSESGASYIYYQLGRLNMDLLKTSTTYTIILDNKTDFIRGIDLQEGNATNKHTLSCKKVNQNIFVITTKNSFEGLYPNNVIIYGHIVNEYKGNVDVSVLSVLEGDWSNRELPSHFEGMKSVGQDDENGHKIEILSQNKNLLKWDRNTVSTGGSFNTKGFTYSVDANNTITVSGTTTDTQADLYLAGSWGQSRAIQTLDVGTYTASLSNLEKDVTLYLINKNSVIASTGYNGKNTFTITEPIDITAIFIRMKPNVEFSNKIVEIQLEKGNVVTSYIQPKLNKKEILLNEPLRALPNGVKDRFVKQGGKWYVERNCGEIDLSTINEWKSWGDKGTEYYGFYQYVSGLSSVVNEREVNVCCATRPCTTDIGDIRTSSCIGVQAGIGDPNGYIAIGFKRSELTELTSYGVKEWLSKNPTKVVAQLKTPIYEPLEVEPTLNTYNDITHISNNSIIPCTMKIKNSGYNAIIKPSTLYTVALDTDKAGTIGMNLGGAKVTTTNNVATITTPATLSDDSLRLYGKGIKGSKVRLLEGDKTNWIPSFFEGMQSSFEDKVQEDSTYKMEILSNNENLFDITKDVIFDTRVYRKDRCILCYEEHTTRMEVLSDEILVRFAQWRGLCFSIWLKPNTTYEVSFDKSGDTYHGLINGRNTKLMTTDSLGKSMWLFEPSSDGTMTIKNIMVREVNNKINQYISHKHNKIQFSSIEPLRGVGNYKDKFIFKDNKLMIERNCRQVNMSELNFAGDTSNVMKCLYIHKSKPMAISNIFSNSRSYESATKGQMYVQERGGGLTYLWIPTDSMSREEFTRFLNEKNATIVYVMSEPTYEEVPFELQKIILEGYENGTLFFDTNIPPTSTVTYAGETPIVKATKLNKTEVLNNTEDINDNIIPYLMDMDYRVVCLQLATEEIEGGVSMARLFGGVYEMLKRDILSKRLSRQEYGYRLADYFNAGKLTEEQVRELEDLR